MTKRTRIFLISAAGVLVLGITAGLIAAYMGVPGFSLSRPNTPAELAYIPQDSTLVAFANVRDVMDSELRKRLADLRPADAPQQNDFEAQTGINVETDVEAVVASFGAGEQNRPLVMVRGSFNQAKIQAALAEHGAETQDYKNERLFVLNESNPPLGLAFVETGVIAAGTVAAVRRAIDTKAARDASVTGNDEVMALVRDMQQGDAWAVGRFDAVASQLPSEVASRVPPIAWLAATGKIDGGVDALVRAETSTDQGAQDLRQVIQGFVALARMQTGQNPQLTTLLNNVQLGGQGRTVSLTFSLPADLIEALGTAARQQQRNRPAPPDAPAPPAPPAPPEP